MGSRPATSARTIAIDALTARFGGTAYAAVQVARSLVREGSAVDRVVVVAERGSIVDRGVAGVPGIVRIAVAPPRRSGGLRRALYAAVRLPEVLRRHDVDGVLLMSSMAFGRLPVPIVGLQANPTMYRDGAGVGGAVRRWLVRRTSGRARATFVPSSAVAALDPQLPRSRVVPLGVDQEVFGPGWQHSTSGPILCVADFYRHKRHDLLLDAHARMAPPRPPLRLIGNPAVDPEWAAYVEGRVRGTEGVRMESGLSLPELVQAYRGARAFVMASTQESFCMPIAEALCVGVPVVATDIPSLRETAGPGSAFVGSDDPDAWAAALERALDPVTADAMSRRGMEHARRFRWSDFADALSEALR